MLPVPKALKLRLVLKAIIAGKVAHQLVALPVIKNAADSFARDAGQGGEVALTDLLMNDDAARSDVFPEIFSKLEQGAGDAAAERQETLRGDCNVGLAQARGEKRKQHSADLRMFFRKSLERGAAEETQY